LSDGIWEDEDLKWKADILKEVRELKDMVGTLMGGGFETPKEAKPKPKPRRKPRKEKEEPMPQSLNPGEFINNLKGSLLTDPIQKDVDTIRGPATVTNTILNTRYGEMRVALWDELGDALLDHVAGDEVTITNLIIKDPFDGVMQVQNTRNTKVR